MEFVPEPSRLVIYGVLHPGDSALSVWISRTRPVNDTKSPLPVLNATALLSQDGQPPVPMLLHNPDEGQYRIALVPQSGSEYELEVTAPGFSPVRARTQVPVPVKHSVVHQVVAINELPEGCAECFPYVARYQLKVTLTDPIGEENYYVVTSTMRLFAQWTGYTSPWYDQLDTITESGDYALDLATDDPFFFHGYEGSEVIRDDELAFSDRLFDGKAQTFRYHARSTEIFLGAKPDMIRESYQLLSRLRTLHPDLYRYQWESNYRIGIGLNDSPLAEPQPLSSNVEGGYGIFSSYSEDTVFIDVDPPGE